ncbi:MAG: TIGR00341 family protein, partial [Flavitalea sp.]
PAYHLYNTSLIIHQGLDAKQKIDLAQIKASILEEVYKDESTRDTIVKGPSKDEWLPPDIGAELKSLYPEMLSYTLQSAVAHRLDSTRTDSILLFTAVLQKPILTKDQYKLKRWLNERLKSDSLVVSLTTGK